jgi:hypothetical protein
MGTHAADPGYAKRPEEIRIEQTMLRLFRQLSDLIDEGA